MEFQCHWSIKSYGMKAQPRYFWGWYLIWALLDIWYWVLRILHTVFGFTRLGNKNRGLVCDPTVCLHDFQCKLSLLSKLCKKYVGINYHYVSASTFTLSSLPPSLPLLCLLCAWSELFLSFHRQRKNIEKSKTRASSVEIYITIET